MLASRDNDVQEKKKPRWLYPGMLPGFVLLVICFAAWGVANNMTDPLVKVFSSVFSMSALQSSLVQFAFYGAYFLLAIPAAFINARLGYKGGVLVGLCLAATGGLLFIPASWVMTYSLFILALFTLAAGCSILETSANPFVMAMGPEENATRRLNFAQSFNPVGSNIGVFMAATLILPHVNPATAAERAKFTEAELIAVRSKELQAVMGPYVGLGIVLILLAIGIAFVKVPRRDVSQLHQVPRTSDKRIVRLLKNHRYSFGVVAQFFNIAAQICIWTYTLHYVTEALNIHESKAGVYLQTSLLIFLVSRFVMVGIMGKVDPRKLMVVMTSLGILLAVIAMFSPNYLGVVCIVSLSACLSLLFPTIYGIALEGLGEDTKFGAAGLVMAIVGGATMPLVQARLIDVTSAAFSYIIPAICFAVILAYAIYAIKTPSPLTEANKVKNQED